MARINDTIKLLVRGLFEDKQALKELDESVTKDSASLKKYMGDNKLDVIDVDSIHVTYSAQVRSSMDEAKTIKIIHELAENAKTDEEYDAIEECIKTKEYIDEDVLENLIYNGIVSKESLEPAINSRTTYTLRMRENKAKE